MTNIGSLTQAKTALSLMRGLSVEPTPTPTATPRVTSSASAIAPISNATKSLAASLASAQISNAAAATLNAGALASSPITLSKGYPQYELYGSRTVNLSAPQNSATETVALEAGKTYAIGTAFGLSDSRGQMKVEILDGSGKVVKSVLAGTSKTSASISLSTVASGTYSIRLTGQPVPKTPSSTNIYGGYQISIGQALSKLPTTSGDANINALVQGGTNSWLHAAGSTATASANVVKTGVKSLNNVIGRPVTYAFMDSAFIQKLTGADAHGASAMQDTQKAAVADAFKYISGIINVNFTEASDPATADIVFGMNNQNGTSAGYANPPNQSGSHQQYLFLASDQSTNSNFSNGSYGWETLVHEIGHTLGLKHPGNYNAGGGGAPGPFLSKTDDNRRNTVMSYFQPARVSANPQTLMAYDIAALQYLYGANTNPTDTEALSAHQKTTFTDAWTGLESLWTPTGGTIDASATTRNNIVDLREGAFSSIAIGADAKANNNVSLAYGSHIDAAKGGSGTDAFYVRATGNATIDGGAGADTLYLAGTAKEWTRDGDTFTRKVSGKTVATVQAAKIENIAYYDPAKAALLHA